MRMARLKAPEDAQVGFYHCISRVVDRRFIFQEYEKEHFVALMRECEAFCGLQILTYCLLSNHFHILVAVPKRPNPLPSGDLILSQLRLLSGHQDPRLFAHHWKLHREASPDQEARFLASYFARMWDVSAFMKLLKQRFTQWYNARLRRKGTLWEDRFKSVLVQGEGQALAAMAAYIDLNPVRAGLVDDPARYRWSGYGEAMAGRRGAKEGLRRVARGLTGVEETLSAALKVYRVFLYTEGDEELESVDEEGRSLRGALKRQEVLRVLEARGRLALGAYLRCRVRYFCDGLVLGSRAYVEEIFGVYRQRFGAQRKRGARRMRGLAGEGLFTLRNLRANVFG